MMRSVRSLHLLYGLLALLAWASTAGAVDTLQVAPQPEPIAEERAWTEFKLPDRIRKIFVDRNGDVWFATLHGVVKYDGYTYRTLTREDGLPEDLIMDITQTRDGAMWFAGRRAGIARLEGDSLRTFTIEDGLASERTWERSFAPTRDGGLWVSHRYALSHFDGATWTAVPSQMDTVGAVVEARDGAIWVGGGSQGLFRYRNGQWHQYRPEHGAFRSWFLAQGSDGTIWAGSIGSIVRYQDGDWRTYGPEDGLKDESWSYKFIWEDRDNRMWASSWSGGFAVLSGERWQTLEAPFKRDAGETTVGRDGTLWTHRYGSTAYRVQVGKLRTWNDVGRALRGGHRQSGVTWFVSEEGPVRYDGRHWLQYGEKDGLLPPPYITMRATEDGSIWFQAESGLCRYAEGRC